ncbi:MAG: OmpW family protein [Gallionella sp.]|nr:OmpW family protein [Gallionella sp.]
MTGTLVAATLFTGAAQAAAGDWLVRGRVISVQPSSSSSPVSGVAANNKATLEADFTRFMTDNVALELILATTKHDISLNGAALGTVGVLPPTLTVQYHFAPDATVSPYLGAGLNYTRFYSVSLSSPLSVKNSSTGGAIQAGLDYKINKDMFVNIDIKKIYMETDVTNAGAYLTTLKIDPVVIGVGLGWKF